MLGSRGGYCAAPSPTFPFCSVFSGSPPDGQMTLTSHKLYLQRLFSTEPATGASVNELRPTSEHPILLWLIVSLKTYPRTESEVSAGVESFPRQSLQ